MAKKVFAYSFKGEYNHQQGMIAEVNKDDIKYYDLFKVLEEFHGKTIKISVAEDQEPTTVQVVD